MASWVTDGSDEFTINGNVVTCMGGDVNAFNVIWQDGEGVSSGQHYWKIHFQALEGGGGVGFTSKDHFKKADACQSIMYSGDLISGGKNGNRCLVRNFGSKPVEGNVIGILAVFESVNLKVYIDVNGRSLGLAFNVPASTFKSIFPMVSFFYSGSAVCTKETNIPNITSWTPATFTGFEGEWKLTKFDDTVITIEDAPRAKFVWKHEGQYEWYVDRLRTKLTFANGMWQADAVVSPGKSRNIERRESENAIRTLMANVRTIKVDGDGTLSVRSDTTSTIWIRHDVAPVPFVGEPFGASKSNEEI
ncbi:hypothetical protein HA402_005206 [Bradysia odoriphaga]|nr:hypothetical protein HA402_005206 [Bradysia odoriphaga]